MEINNLDRKWIVREPGNPAHVRQLAQELGVDRVLPVFWYNAASLHMSRQENFSVLIYPCCMILSL